MVEEAKERARLDKWLWAARFYKTRSAAAQAIAGGKVHLNGVRAKAGKMVGAGDDLRIRKGAEEFSLVVLGVTGRRGSGADAQALYEETAESERARAKLRAEARHDALVAHRPKGLGRPTKKERRELEDLKRRRQP